MAANGIIETLIGFTLNLVKTTRYIHLLLFLLLADINFI